MRTQWNNAHAPRAAVHRMTREFLVAARESTDALIQTGEMMARRIWLVMFLQGATLLAYAAPPAPPAPQQPWKPHVLVIPRLTCTLTLPAGWSAQRPMPDHILELWTFVDGGPPRPELTVEEGDAAGTLTAGVNQFRARMERVWGKDALVLAAQEPISGVMKGQLLKYERRVAKGAPRDTMWAAVYVVDGTVVHALVASRDAVDNPQLSQALNTLSCAPKPR